MAAFGKLKISDFLKGLLIAVGVALGTGILKYTEIGVFPSTWADWKGILVSSVTAMIVYILKNLVTNSQGQVFKSEPK